MSVKYSQNNDPQAQQEPRSPCIRHCCLDENDVCLGCFRHIDEIMAWGNASIREKQHILKQAEKRSKAKPA